MKFPPEAFRRPERQERPGMFREFDATELYCPKCRQAVPVRKRLLNISVRIVRNRWEPRSTRKKSRKGLFFREIVRGESDALFNAETCNIVDDKSGLDCGCALICGMGRISDAGTANDPSGIGQRRSDNH